MKKTDREVVSELFEKRTGVPYQNWIQAMALTIFLPTGCVLSWYVLYKLLMWIFS